MRYYHVYTKGLEDSMIYRSHDDYVAGMNLLAVTHFKSGVTLLAFVLMSNHFHFVLYGSKEVALKFINLYKKLISRYIMNKYGESAFLRRVLTSCDEISLADEGVKKVIAYVLDNPVKAGICSLPYMYKWGSISCYYNSSSVDLMSSEIPGRRRMRRILHSNIDLPSEYKFSTGGYIDPISYVDSRMVERIFVRAKSFEYFLSTSASSRQSRKDVIVFSDSLMVNVLDELLKNKYCSVIELMDETMKRSLLLDLRKYFNASSKQLARITGLPLKTVLTLLQ